jgi:hypothetical protein
MVLWSQGPTWRRAMMGDHAQGLSRQMLLSSKELASLAPVHEVFSISLGRGPVETRSVSLAD